MKRAQRSEWLTTEQLKRGRNVARAAVIKPKRSVKVLPTLIAVVVLIIASEAIIRWLVGG